MPKNENTKTIRPNRILAGQPPSKSRIFCSMGNHSRRGQADDYKASAPGERLLAAIESGFVEKCGHGCPLSVHQQPGLEARNHEARDPEGQRTRRSRAIA